MRIYIAFLYLTALFWICIFVNLVTGQVCYGRKEVHCIFVNSMTDFWAIAFLLLLIFLTCFYLLRRFHVLWKKRFFSARESVLVAISWVALISSVVFFN